MEQTTIHAGIIKQRKKAILVLQPKAGNEAYLRVYAGISIQHK